MVFSERFPDIFLRIQFRTVGREVFQFERSAMFPQEVLHQRSFVVRRAIDDHDHVAIHMFAEIAEEFGEGDLVEVNGLYAKTKLTMVRDRSKHFDAPLPSQRGTLRTLADSRPGSMHRSLRAQADFVFEKDGCPFFFARRAIRGISSFSQRFWASRSALANVTAGHCTLKPL